MTYKLVIPARMGSTRLPEKALLDVAGAPLVVRVWQRARESRASEVIVAVDDARLARVIEEAGGVAQMTSAEHASGTDRLAEVAAARGWGDDTVVVNLQGDEPLVPPALLDRLAEDLTGHPACGLATVATPVASLEEATRSSVVKVVCRADGRALYFSRAPIPFARGAFDAEPPTWPEGAPVLRHLGLYAYRAGTLARLAAAPRSPLERLESLEQLRALDLGLDIHVRVIDEAPPPGVDVPEDLARVRAIFAEGATAGELA